MSSGIATKPRSSVSTVPHAALTITHQDMSLLGSDVNMKGTVWSKVASNVMMMIVDGRFELSAWYVIHELSSRL